MNRANRASCVKAKREKKVCEGGKMVGRNVRAESERVTQVSGQTNGG